MSEPADDDLATKPIVQRTVSAADVPRLAMPSGNGLGFQWPWPPQTGAEATQEAHESGPTDAGDAHQTGSANDTTPAAGATAANPPQPSSTPEGEPMAKKNGGARARKSASGSPQLQICSALLQNDLTRDEIAQALPNLTTAQISSALNNAKAHKRVKWKDAEGVYSLTGAGRTWLEVATGEAPAEPAETKAPRKSAVHRRGKRARQANDTGGDAVDTSPAADAPPTFRCAVMSDGCFFITKDGTTIELEPEEHKQMLHYLERMAEADAA